MRLQGLKRTIILRRAHVGFGVDMTDGQDLCWIEVGFADELIEVVFVQKIQHVLCEAAERNTELRLAQSLDDPPQHIGTVLIDMVDPMRREEDVFEIRHVDDSIFDFLFQIQ